MGKTSGMTLHKSINIKLIISLLLPICVLLTITLYKHSITVAGKEYTLPILGFDPRDLLSGHYLRYRIDYGTNMRCEAENRYVCLTSKSYLDNQTDLTTCPHYISGSCDNGQFKAGLERFYIPEKQAITLEKYVMDAKGSIVISVNRSGEAVIKDLLINGCSWRQYETDTNGIESCRSPH